MQKTYIPGYRIDWRRVVTTHTKVGVNSLSINRKYRLIKYCTAIYSLKPMFSVRNFIIDNLLI